MKITEEIRQEITQIEFRDDISNDKKISNIIHIGCAICAGVAIQPLSFADILILTPLQGYFASWIAAIHGIRHGGTANRAWGLENGHLWFWRLTQYSTGLCADLCSAKSC